VIGSGVEAGVVLRCVQDGMGRIYIVPERHWFVYPEIEKKGSGGLES
jgi:hypothetical protein